MTTRDLTAIVGADIRSWAKPPADQVPPLHRASYLARCDALTAVVGGMACRPAGSTYRVDPRTVARDAKNALRLGPDGVLLGFRACLPFRHRLPRGGGQTKVAPPTNNRAYAFTRLLESTDAARVVADKYNGPLPSGKAKSRAFERHIRAFLAAVRAANGERAYPLNEADKGRRALLNYHKRIRDARREAGAVEVDEAEPEIKRFNQLFNLAPLDRLEFDAHKQDVDWEFEITRPDGHMVLRKIQSVTLLAVVCAVSRYLLAYVLVLGAYNRLDVLRLFHRALQPWRPRELTVTGMVYPEGAQLGLPVDDDGAGPRGIVIAGDNALAHHADIAVDNLLEHHRGLLNLGRAHVPEGRPIIEAFFRRLEQGALRQIAGGFQPETRISGEKVSTSYLRAQDHPLHWEGLLDLMDVIAAGYNITPHYGLHNRTPASVLATHLTSGWSWFATEATRDAQKLTTTRFSATIRGKKSAGRHPFVQYHEAYYRSQRLMGRWDLVGRKFIAEVNIEDLRHVVLLDPDDGTPWSRLAALPPWDRSRHDLHLRQQIIRSRNRGLLEIAGAQDAVAAFHAFTRSQALCRAAAPDLHARIHTQLDTEPRSSVTTPSSRAVEPRAGRATFANRKD